MKYFPKDVGHFSRRLSFRCFRPRKFDWLQKRRDPYDQYRCIFVHIPKCAGISVCRSIFGEDFMVGHMGLRRFQIMFSPREFNDYFKFSFVRNPYDRLVSAFLFLKKGGLNDNDKRLAEKYLAAYDDFDTFVRKWLNKKNIQLIRHFQPQCDFICLRKNRPSLDFIGYFENLQEDYAFISRKLGVKTDLLEENRNASRKMDYREYYTNKTKKIVAETYANDIRALGYTFGNSKLSDQLARRNINTGAMQIAYPGLR